MPRRSAPNLTQADMGYRELQLRSSTFDDSGRSVLATISTESPVAMPDWSRMQMVPEVLMSSGAEFPKSRQVPFLDSHNRWSVKDQLGSARDITVESGAISARLVFSQTTHGGEAMAAVRDGHVTDVSVGYEVLKRIYVEEGKTKTISGREFSGPVNVVTKWRLREVSLTPIGADAQAKLRGLDPAAVRFQSSEKEVFQMNPELRKLLVSRGMPEALTDDEAQRWQIDNFDKVAPKEDPAPKKEQRSEQITTDNLASMITDAARKIYEEERASRAKFESEVSALCELAGMPEKVAECRLMADVASVRKFLQDAQQKSQEQIPYGASVRMVSSGFDRLSEDIRSTLILKAVRTAANNDSKKVERYFPAAERSKSADQLTNATLLDLATEFVRAQGVQTLGLTREQIAICAMFGPEKAGVRSFRGDNPYHTTGSFANLTLDAINKSLSVGYNEVPATWRGPMRQGDSVSDFKQIHRVRLGGIPNLPVWNDTDRPDTASMKDAKESYAVECRSIGVPFSYKLIVNDDLSALSRVPVGLGDSAARTVNAVAWSQITSNPTMEDGVALFSAATGNRKQKNTETGAISNYTTALNTMTANMMVVRGENTPENNQGQDILALMPRYLAFPAALRGTLLQLLESESDPNATHAGSRNINTNLIPVLEPLLDASSTTAIYLFAEPTRIDTVEITFLQGQETPVVRSVMDEHTLSMTYYVLQSVGAKPLNWRGIQRHAGA